MIGDSSKKTNHLDGLRLRIGSWQRLFVNQINLDTSKCLTENSNFKLGSLRGERKFESRY